ncbi:TPA: hypothetical protein HA246_03615 [Candidatus Woesearchaeota archaeon]|nr:hypothetical protein [Candidatus Woesearchaeota archaeon]
MDNKKVTVPGYYQPQQVEFVLKQEFRLEAPRMAPIGDLSVDIPAGSQVYTTGSTMPQLPNEIASVPAVFFTGNNLGKMVRELYQSHSKRANAAAKRGLPLVLTTGKDYVFVTRFPKKGNMKFSERPYGNMPNPESLELLVSVLYFPEVNSNKYNPRRTVVEVIGRYATHGRAKRKIGFNFLDEKEAKAAIDYYQRKKHPRKVLVWQQTMFEEPLREVINVREAEGNRLRFRLNENILKYLM